MSFRTACLLLMAFFGSHQSVFSADAITAPPAHLKTDPFYQKHISIDGLPILSSQRVSDAGLREAALLIRNMVGHAPKVLAAMVKADVRIVVMHANEMTTDVPEQRHMKPKKFWDLRARGLGGRITSCGEENLLNLPGDRYATENILIHEFAHCMHGNGLRHTDPTFNKRLKAAYDKAIAKGLWKDTYAATNHGEYWAEGVQSWFNTNRQNDSLHNHVDTREELKAYDPVLAALLKEVHGDGPWRYQRYDVRQKGRAAPFRFLRFYADMAFDGRTGPTFLRTADLDGDGDLDMVAGGGRGLYIYQTGGRVAEWKRFGNLDETRSMGGQGGVLKDADGDGDLDLIAAQQSGPLGWWENPGLPLGKTAWPFHPLAETKGRLQNIVQADLDNDGRAESCVAALLTRRQGKTVISVISFSPPTAADQAKGPWPLKTIAKELPVSPRGCRAGMDTGDINGDGRRDIAFSSGWFQAPAGGTGQWTWHPVADLTGISNTLLRDMDGDGDLDMVVSGGHKGRGVFWYACPAQPSGAQAAWKRHAIDDQLRHPRGLAVLDVDADGDQDVIACELDSARWHRQCHQVYIFENKGTTRKDKAPGWQKHPVSKDSFACQNLQVADIEKKGRLDFFGTGGGHGVISFYQNASPKDPAP